MRTLGFGCFPFFHGEIRFDEELHRQLAREGCPEVSSGAEPDVRFVVGETNGNLGSFCFETKVIKIGVSETLFVLIEDHPRNVDRLKRRFRCQLLKTLAHETSHWRLDKQVGKWARIEREVLSSACTCLFLFLWVLLAFLYVTFVPRTLDQIGPLGLKIPVLILAVFGFWGLSRALRKVRRILRYHVIHWWCWHERSARAFATKMVRDRRWREVIKVD